MIITVIIGGVLIIGGIKKSNKFAVTVGVLILIGQLTVLAGAGLAVQY